MRGKHSCVKTSLHANIDLNVTEHLPPSHHGGGAARGVKINGDDRAQKG